MNPISKIIAFIKKLFNRQDVKLLEASTEAKTDALKVIQTVNVEVLFCKGNGLGIQSNMEG